MTEQSHFLPVERLPEEELAVRHARCRENLARFLPPAGGLLVAGSPNIYYMTGTSANGLLWLPLEGEPVLLVRKGLERARLESPVRAIRPFRSYKDLAGLVEECGSPFTANIAVDQAGTSWEQGRMLCERLAGHTFLPADMVLARTRALKSEWELVKMRESCRLLHLGQMELAGRIRPGMSEYAIAQTLWALFAEHGNNGCYPTGMTGSAILLGHVSAGGSSLYPTGYDGPLGVVGVHPAAPVMGSLAITWEKERVLAVDTGFVYDGYISDRTQIFFSGAATKIPAEVRKAQDACIAIQKEIAALLRPGASPEEIYLKSLEVAERYGFADRFMGIGEGRRRFVGHGIGLTVSEWPIFARGFAEPLCTGMTVALEPKISLPGIAMVGVENTYEITESGAVSLTGTNDDIICV